MPSQAFEQQVSFSENQLIFDTSWNCYFLDAEVLGL